VVARPLCKRKAPGSIPGVSNSLFDSPSLAQADAYARRRHSIQHRCGATMLVLVTHPSLVPPQQGERHQPDVNESWLPVHSPGFWLLASGFWLRGASQCSCTRGICGLAKWGLCLRLRTWVVRREAPVVRSWRFDSGEWVAIAVRTCCVCWCSAGRGSEKVVPKMEVRFSILLGA
jgi:hypothetical protein